MRGACLSKFLSKTTNTLSPPDMFSVYYNTICGYLQDHSSENSHVADLFRHAPQELICLRSCLSHISLLFTLALRLSD